jgi:hypothetical protein
VRSKDFKKSSQEIFTKTLLPMKQPNIKQGLPVKKKPLLTAVSILMLLLSAVAGAFLVRLGKANPETVDGEGWMWIKEGEVPAPEGIEHPQILFSSPINETYASDKISLIFNASSPRKYMSVSIDYKPSWQSNYSNINSTTIDYVNITLTKIPEGSNHIEVKAEWTYVYESRLDTTQRWITHYTSYTMNCSETVYFNVDTHSNSSQQSTLNNPQPFPTSLIVASVIKVAVVGVGLLVYFKKRKH